MTTRVPWPWIAVTAYGTTLAWSFSGDLFGDRSVIETISEWQTLIAGLAAVTALVYAGRQLQMDRSRDRRAYLLQHTTEWEALEALIADLDAFVKRRSLLYGAFLKTRSGHGTLNLDPLRWQRLNELCAPAIDAPLREFIRAAQMYDGLIQMYNTGPTPRLSEHEASMIEGHLALLTDSDGAMRAAITRRKQAILALAPSDL